MNISINNPVQQTWIFVCVFVFVCLVSLRRKKQESLSPSITEELKGFAILSVVFGHIGYFLATDHRFLFPLSVMAGVGVNMFLFLSGYGLTMSRIKNNEVTIFQFYKKRLLKLYKPFWIVLCVFLLADALILGIVYPRALIVQSFVGIFTRADMVQSLNAPLWYFTLILVYYILFPLVFSRKRPWVSALILYGFTYFILNLDLDFLSEVSRLYKVHLIAFPLGVVSVNLFKGFKLPTGWVRYLAMSILIIIIGYTAIHSGVGSSVAMEQGISILTMLALVLLFILKKNESALLGLFGLYSYEIYLIHWPLLYQYDIFYTHMPAWLATSLYLVFFVLLGMFLKACCLHKKEDRSHLSASGPLS